MAGSWTLLRSDGTEGNMPMYKLSNSMGNMALGENGHEQKAEDTNEEEDEDNDNDSDEESEDDGIEDFAPPKYIVDEKPKTPVVPPPTPLALRKVGRSNSFSEVHCCLFRAPNQAIQTPDQHRTSTVNRVFSPIDAGLINR
jgi:hypothetical protein